MKSLRIAIFWLGLCLEVFAHGRSPEMIRELNAPVPDWMSVGEPIKVEPIEGHGLPVSFSFRPRSGGATNSRNRVQIPERGIEFQVPHEIDWRGINEEGYGVSLNAEGTKLVVNTGMTSRLYQITSDGAHREVPIQLPHVTYDDGLKGFITGWSWAGNDVLVGRAEITDETGDEIIEGRIYVFHLEERALARLDLSALNLPDTAGIEIASIGDDLEHLRICLGDRDFAVKADLKSPPRLLAESDPAPASHMQVVEQLPAQKESSNTQLAPSSSSSKPPSSMRWPLVLAVVMAAMGLLWLLVRSRK